MNKLEIIILSACAGLSCLPAVATEPVKLEFEICAGYLVSFEVPLYTAETYHNLWTQDQFDHVFATDPALADTARRAPKGAFDSRIVLAVVKRGKTLLQFKVEGVSEMNGIVRLRYNTTAKKTQPADFVSSLIVSIPKVHSSAFQFVENGKIVSGGRFRIYFESWDKIIFEEPWISEGKTESPRDRAHADHFISRFKGQMLPSADVDLGPKGLKPASKKLKDEVQEWLAARGVTEVRFSEAANVAPTVNNSQ